jgi:hypothetical protein
VFMKMWELGGDERLLFRKGSILKYEESAKLCDVSHARRIYSAWSISLPFVYLPFIAI